MPLELDLTLLIDRVAYETPDIIVLDLVAPDGVALPRWTPGAHIDLVLKSGKVRQYSLFGDTDDFTRYRIAVLREEAGRGGSVEVHTNAEIGTEIAGRGPRNHFELTDAPHYLFLAGGIGITPILPMIRTAERVGRPWRLVYGGRSRATMGFLAEVKQRCGGEVTLLPQDECGLPDFDALLAGLTPNAAIYGCGPSGMLETLEAAAGKQGLDGVLHVERFSAPQETSTPAQAQDRSFEVELRKSGLILHVPADRSLRNVLQDASIPVPFSCQEGYCGSCETRVLEGLPEHRDLILNETERAENQTMMVCVGRAISARLVLDL